MQISTYISLGGSAIYFYRTDCDYILSIGFTFFHCTAGQTCLSSTSKFFANQQTHDKIQEL